MRFCKNDSHEIACLNFFPKIRQGVAKFVVCFSLIGALRLGPHCLKCLLPQDTKIVLSTIAAIQTHSWRDLKSTKMSQTDPENVEIFFPFR